MLKYAIEILLMFVILGRLCRLWVGKSIFQLNFLKFGTLSSVVLGTQIYCFGFFFKYWYDHIVEVKEKTNAKVEAEVKVKVKVKVKVNVEVKAEVKVKVKVKFRWAFLKRCI